MLLINTDNLGLTHVMHHPTDSGQIALFFETSDWYGEVANMELHKCVGWEFADPGALPGDVVSYIAQALRHIAAADIYSKDGWC